jgi:outer membrane protein OmpA-like peptidoglycan-associated protein
MKKVISAILVLLLAATLSTFLTGCGNGNWFKAANDSKEEPMAVCFVVNKHANAPEISAARFYDYVYNCSYNYGSVAAVTVEGVPRMICDYKVNPPEKHVDTTKRRQIAANHAQTILAQIAAAEASTPEADRLTALSMSSDVLGSKTEAVKLLCIDDSFLSTAGLLNFAASNLLEQDPDSIVEQLNARYAIPDLSGIDVLLLGLGQTCGSQAALGPTYEHKLEAIWTAIFKASDCASLSIDRTPLGSDEPKSEFPVSTITVITESLTFTTSAKIKAEETGGDVEIRMSDALIPEVVRFDETTIQFAGDSDAFVDSEFAFQTIVPVAQILRDNPDVKVVLAGMTASVGGDGIELSLKRAEAVKALLTSAGASEAQIRCVGLGRADNCLRVNDLDPDGNLIESMAKINRSVFLFAEGSDTANKLNIH